MDDEGELKEEDIARYANSSMTLQELEAKIGKQHMKNANYSKLVKLIISKSKNNREYKKYNEVVGDLMLNYYKRFGDIEKATAIIYTLIENAKDVSELKLHQKVLAQEDLAESGVDNSIEHSKAKIANTLLNDYKKRFGEKKGDTYNMLVLQSWVSKVDNVNELVILMDNIFTIRDKVGNSWDYEVHILPLLLELSYTSETLVDLSTSTTNLVIGLNKKLKDNYLAVMTAVKILEYSGSSKMVKTYIRDLIKEAGKNLDDASSERQMLSSDGISRFTKAGRIRELDARMKELTAHIDELMNGIDPKELMLGSTKREA